MDSELYMSLLKYFNAVYPQWHVHSYLARPQHADSTPLTDTVILFDYVTMRGQRFYSSSFSGVRSSALAEVQVPWLPTSACGEILEIFQFQQNISQPVLWLARMRWFKPWSGDCEAVWTQL